MNTTSNKTILPFWQGLIYPLTVIHNNSLSFLNLTIVFSLLITTLSFLLGSSYICSLNSSAPIFCSLSPTLSIIFMILFLCLISIYTNRLLLITSTNISLKEALKTLAIKKDLKALAILLLNFTAWIAIACSMYFLTTRKATPNFYYELGYFIIFSLIILLAVTYLLNNVLSYRFLENKPFLLLHKTFWIILDNLHKFLLWFLFNFIFFYWILKTITMQILTSPEKNSYIFYYIGEFMFNFSILFITAYWILQLQYQSKQIFADTK